MNRYEIIALITIVLVVIVGVRAFFPRVLKTLRNTSGTAGRSQGLNRQGWDSRWVAGLGLLAFAGLWFCASLLHAASSPTGALDILHDPDWLDVPEVLERASTLTTIAGRPVKPKLLHKDPNAAVVQIDDFLTLAQSEEMVGLVQKVIHGPWEEDEEDIRDNSYVLAHNPDAWTRKCRSKCVKYPIIAVMDSLISELTSRPDCNMEQYQLLHYGHGQRYGKHHDFVHSQSQQAQGPREFTVLLYLTDVAEGGETHFPELGLKVRPKQGRMLMWPNVDYTDRQRLNRRTHHESIAVITGKKYVATQWVHEGDFRTRYQTGPGRS